MNMRVLSLSVLAMLMILFSTMTLASSDEIYSEDKPNIMLTAKQPEFTIQLKSNPTTGFAWFLQDYDNNLLTPIKHRYQSSMSKLVGAGGYELWTFRVKPNAFVVPHQTAIHFVYVRPWDAGQHALEKVFQVTTGK